MAKDIWFNRLSKEFQGMSKGGTPTQLPEGVRMENFELDKESGIGKGHFTCYIPMDRSSEAIDMVPRIDILLDVGFATKYPFDPPVIHVVEGQGHLSKSFVNSDRRVRLPILRAWTPSTTMSKVLQEFVLAVQKGDGELIASDESKNVEPSLVGKSIPIFGVPGSMYAVIQDAGDEETEKIKFLVVGKEALYSVVQLTSAPFEVSVTWELKLSQIERISYKPERSVTIYSKEKDVPMSFGTSQASDCVQQIRWRLVDLGLGVDDPRSRSDSFSVSSAARAGSLDSSIPSSWGKSPSLDDAKEVSKMLYNKLGGMTNSLSKPMASMFSGLFHSSDDDERTESGGLPSNAASTSSGLDLDERLDYLKQMEEHVSIDPSMKLVKEVTEMYMQAAEHCAAVGDERHEQILKRLHAFLERPDVQNSLAEESEGTAQRDKREGSYEQSGESVSGPHSPKYKREDGESYEIM